MDVSLVLALASALAWGAGDFFGGLATRNAKVVGTTFVAQFVGLVGLAAVAALGAGGPLVRGDLAWGTGAGLCAVLGLAMFYEAMGRGPFGPVASITSVVSGTIPILVGLALGERPSWLVLAGAAVAVVAIWLIAGERRIDGEPDGARSALLLAAGAGVLFGGYFVLLSRAGGEAGLWTVVAGRAAASVGVGLVIVILGRGGVHSGRNGWGRMLPRRPEMRLAAIAGALDATANALYFYASRHGMLSVVAVLASLYPASTIVLARLALRERVLPRRLAGMALGLFAVAIISRGGIIDIAPAHDITRPAVSNPTNLSDLSDPTNNELLFEPPLRGIEAIET